MKPTLLIAIALASCATFAADWTFDGTYVSDGAWTFNATASGTNLTVGTPVAANCPTTLTALDFSKPVTGSDGETAYTIAVLNCKFSGATDVRSYIGELTLPGEGLTTIEANCFQECANMTGELVFPSTLSTIKGAAFYNSKKITCDASKLPTGITTLGVQVFYYTGLYGDLRLPNLVGNDFRSTFQGTKITSVYLGPGVTGLWGYGGWQGPFQDNAYLTNVTFDANCSVYLKGESVFDNCPKLTELDLSCVHTIDGGVGHFNKCTNLKKITFGPKLISMGANAFKNATGLEEIVFTGPPPTTFGLPYLQNAPATSTIKTTVYKANYATKNSAGLSWLDYAENGEIHSTGSTFASTNVSVSAALRPLVAPDLAINADATVYYVANGVFGVTATVTQGSGELYVVATDTDGNAVTNVLSTTAEASKSYSTYLNGLTSGHSYALALLSNVDGNWEMNDPFDTMFNGQLSVVGVASANRGTGACGSFKFYLGGGVLAAGDIQVSYSLGSSTTASSGTDFAELSGTVTIPKGANFVTVPVIPLPSGETADEIVQLQLTNVKRYLAGISSSTITIYGSSSFGGWIVDASALTMSNSVWQFAITLDGDSGIDVGAVNTDTAKGPVPSELSPLDLSTAVIGTDGTAYTIVKLGGLFQTATALRPYVGALTLPGEGLTAIGAHAFNSCTKATGDIVFPSTLTAIGAAAFYTDSKLSFDAAKISTGITSLGVQVFCNTSLYGDLKLPNLVGTDFRSTFQGTKLTSIVMGPGVTELQGGYDQGFIQNCTKLTNVVLQADSVYMWYCFIFRGCTSLKELDLSMVSKLENYTEDGSSYCGGFFDNSGIERITFGPNIQKVSSRSFENANKLKEIVFQGPPPVSLPEPYLYGAAQCVTTVVYKSQLSVTNSAGKCWLDYAADGRIKHRGTTFDAEHVSVDSELRPLVTRESTEGLVLFIR